MKKRLCQIELYLLNKINSKVMAIHN